MTKTTPETHAKPVNLRIREDVRVLIDRAAKIRGKTRSDFMIDAAYRAAEDTLLDQALIKVDPESYQIISTFLMNHRAAKVLHAL